MLTIRAKFTKGNDLIYIGHLDLIRVFKRAFLRADIPADYSQGFNPQPKLSFATALSLGVESDGEYMDLELTKEIDCDEFVNKVNEVLPHGIKLVKAKYIDGKHKIMSLIRWSSYIIELNLEDTIEEDIIRNSIKEILDRKEIIVIKEKKKDKRKDKRKVIKKEVDIRDLIKDIDLLLYEKNRIIIKTMLKTGSVGNLKPEIIVDLINEKEEINIMEDMTKIKRLELFIEDGGKIVPALRD